MGKLLKVEEYEVSDEIIERDRLFSVYVLGLPQSGTSMMTHNRFKKEILHPGL